MEIKIAVSMIVFNSDFVIKQCLESIYPFVEQIIVNNAKVSYWQNNPIKEDETKEDKVILNRLDDLIKNIQQIKNSIK